MVLSLQLLLRLLPSKIKVILLLLLTLILSTIRFFIITAIFISVFETVFVFVNVLSIIMIQLYPHCSRHKIDVQTVLNLQVRNPTVLWALGFKGVRSLGVRG